MTLPLTLRAHALYRFYDAAGDLLYVGLTADPGTRWKTHSRQKEWWHEVTTIRVEHFPDRVSVEAAERHAIQTERPRYNSKHNGGQVARRPASQWRLDLPADVSRRLVPNRNLSTFTVKPEPPAFGQWLLDIFEDGCGYDAIFHALTRNPAFQPAMHPGHVELLLHQSGDLNSLREGFTEAREIHNHLRGIAGSENRIDVYDLRADAEQIWTPRRIRIWFGEATAVYLDRGDYAHTLGARGTLSPEFRLVASTCFREGQQATKPRQVHQGALCGVDDDGVGLVVPQGYADLAISALLAAELDRDLAPMRRLSGAMSARSVR